MKISINIKNARFDCNRLKLKTRSTISYSNITLLYLARISVGYHIIHGSIRRIIETFVLRFQFGFLFQTHNIKKYHVHQLKKKKYFKYD